jgi:site-specific recombinase XerD
MKDHIRPPVKIDAQGRVIKNPKTAAHRWRLNIPASITGTKKERRFFKTESEAKQYAQSLLGARETAGTDLLGRLQARGMSVADAIEYALSHAPSKGSSTVANACKAYIDSRRADNRKERYLAILKSQLDLFEVDFGERTVDSISKSDIERFVAGLTAKDGKTPAAPKTRLNFIITLTALFNYAVSEGWRGENPAAKIRRPALDEVSTAILSPAEVAKLLTVASRAEYQDVFPAMLLQLFVGPRRSEIPHITWESIKDNYLRLDRTKVRQKRSVELNPTLLAWLAPFSAHRSGRVFAPANVEFDVKDTRKLEDAYTYRLEQIGSAAEVALPKNVLRHTAITYRHALTGDLNETALWAGNSPRIIEQHYRGAATKTDAISFYALKPGGDEKVVPIAAG